MSIHRTLLVALMLTGTATAIGCEASRPPELLLRVPVERLTRYMQQRSFPHLSPGDSVELRMPGEWFEPPRELSVIARDSADLSSPLSASVAIYSAFKQSDNDWIVASFAERDRAIIRRFLGDSNVRAGSRGYFAQVVSKQIVGWATYATDSADYRLVFVRRIDDSPTPDLETFVWEAEEWRRTNRLVKDSVAQIAWRAYRFGTVTQK